MKKMIQTNMSTGFDRAIKIEIVEDRIPEPLWTADIEGNKY